jgi:O-antigen/teichoic acid export membrane protein
LRWSEKYFKTDMVYLARGGFWLTLGQTISSLSSFLLVVAFANLLPKETYGTYKYVLSIAGILAISTLSGMSTAIIQAVARGYEGSLVPALKTKIRWGLLGGLAGLILAGYYFYQGNITLTVSFLISAVFLPFMDSFGIYDAFLQGRKLFDISAKYGIISQIIAVIILITTLFFTKNLFFILFVYFLDFTSFFLFQTYSQKIFAKSKTGFGNNFLW